ncbi:MAG: T9SS type A sorting domain-containing protein [Bacteroidales bacterium]|nr:T9SS type A sorting domain-containing protein [Bacteroidales bacterium]
MKRFMLSFVLCLVFLPAIFAQEVNGIIVSDTANLIVIKIWGSHEERGYAYGYLLGEEISEMVTGYMVPTFGPYLDEARQVIIDGNDLRIDSVFISESMAVVEGMNAAGTNYANIDYIDGLVFNAFLDIVKLLGLTADKPGCSSLMSWGDATNGTNLDGKSVISRHLDWSPDQTLIDNQVIVVNIPSEADEQPWVMVGFAGQMSVLSGFNANVAVFQHMMSDYTNVTTHGVKFEPIWLTLRKSIEKLDFNNDGENNIMDVWDAISINTMGYADGYIITALAPSSAGQDSLISIVAEVAPKEPYITFRSNSYPDDIPGDNLYAANFEIKRNNHNHYCSRYYAVINAIGNGTGIGSDKNWEIMRDHSNGGTGNIQFMQFIPELDLFRISVYRDGSPAYLKPPVDFCISELLYFPVGISSYPQYPDLYLFPNPVKENLNVMLEGEYIGLNYFIYSFDGRMRLSGVLEKEKNQISVGVLPAGVYFLRMKDSGTVKFVKM